VERRRPVRISETAKFFRACARAHRDRLPAGGRSRHSSPHVLPTAGSKQ
jgi:hypothetical protein